MWKKLLFTFLFIFSTIWVGSAAAGCKINVGVKNTGDIKIRFMQLHVKSKGGSWAYGGSKGWSPFKHLAPGASHSDGYNATFGCKAKRRYRFTYKCEGSPIEEENFDYFPTATGWTKDINPVVKLSRCKN